MAAEEHSSHHGQGTSNADLAGEPPAIAATSAAFDSAGAGPVAASFASSVSASTYASHSSPSSYLPTVAALLATAPSDDPTPPVPSTTDSSTTAVDDDYSPPTPSATETLTHSGACTASGTDAAMSSHYSHHPGPGPPPESVHYPTTFSSAHSSSNLTPAATTTSSIPAVRSHATTVSSSYYSNYSPAHSHHPPEVYEPNPIHSNSMSLPSMRTIDPLAHHSSHSASSTPGLGISGLPMPMPQIPSSASYYPPQPPVALPSSYGITPDAAGRYALPHDPRILHRAPKKEIKRRTKTGCLTCRKRRIKCDEGHPTCNNCRKSKRDCLGYDPIFRQQTVHLVGSYNNNNQGSTDPLSSGLGTNSSQSTPVLPSATGSSPSIAPEPSLPVSSNKVGTRPLVLPSTYTPPSSRSIKAEPPTLSQHVAAPIKTEPGSQIPSADINSPSLRARMMRIEEILNLLGPAPAAQPVTLDEQTFTEITKVYHEMYAGPLSAFFETNWYYFSENGKMSFPRYHELVDHMASFLQLLGSVKTNDLAQMAYSGAFETRIVWELARTAAAVDKPSHAVRIGLPPDGDPAEARSRFQIVEALLCGDLLSSNPLCPPFQDNDTHRSRQFDFWYHLGEFIRKRDDSDSHATHNAKEEVLNRLRHLLDGRENRDILYSIAVARELAPQFDANYANTIPQHLDETDPKNRLAVASKFIVDESQVTGGTTNVVRRISDIAARAFVNPGINVARAT